MEEFWLVGGIDLMRDLRMKNKTEFNEHQLRRHQNSSNAKDDDVKVRVFGVHAFFLVRLHLMKYGFSKVPYTMYSSSSIVFIHIFLVLVPRVRRGATV